MDAGAEEGEGKEENRVIVYEEYEAGLAPRKFLYDTHDAFPTPATWLTRFRERRRSGEVRRVKVELKDGAVMRDWLGPIYYTRARWVKDSRPFVIPFKHPPKRIQIAQIVLSGVRTRYELGQRIRHMAQSKVGYRNGDPFDCTGPNLHYITPPPPPSPPPPPVVVKPLAERQAEGREAIAFHKKYFP